MAYLGRSPSQGVRNRYYKTASGGETSISGALTGGTLTFTDGNYVDVNLNGVTLVAGTDYNTSTANTIAGLSALTANDVVEIVVYDVFSVFSGNVNSDFSVGGNLTVTGSAEINSLTYPTADGSNGQVLKTNGSGTLSFGTVSTDLVNDTSPQLGGVLDTNGNNIEFPDSSGAEVNRLKFGAGDDLQIYHDGNNSAILENGTGDFWIGGDNALNITKASFGEYKARFVSDGAVELYYDNSKKFETTSTGVDVTGGLNTTGNVGIGTSSPTLDGSLAGLSVNGSGTVLQVNDGDGATLKLTDPATGANRGLGITLQGTSAAISNCESGELRFGTGNTERARFDSSGNFLIGTTNAAPRNFSSSTYGIRFIGDQPEFGIDTAYFNKSNGAGTLINFRQSGTDKGTIAVSSSGTTYNTTSDIRLKQDIEPLEATDKLMAMNPVSYNWKADPNGPRSMGFIAQQMQEVMPEAVSTGDDDIMSMDYGRITPILVSALQDAHRKIEQLESRLAAMETANE